MRTLFVFLTSLIFIFSSCKKNENTPTCTPSQASIAGNWTMYKVTYKASGSNTEVAATNDLYATCRLDNVVAFNASGTYTETDGGVVCSPSSAGTGTWAYNGSNITINGVPFLVESYSCSDIKLSTQSIFNGTAITLYIYGKRV